MQDRAKKNQTDTRSQGIIFGTPCNSHFYQCKWCQRPGSITWRRAWQLTPVFLLGESHGQRSLVGHRPWSHSRTRLKWLSTHSQCVGQNWEEPTDTRSHRIIGGTSCNSKSSLRHLGGVYFITGKFFTSRNFLLIFSHFLSILCFWLNLGCSQWGCKESDTPEWLNFHFLLSCIGKGSGNPLQCSCLENPRDGGAWWAAIYGVTHSWTQLKWLSSSSHPS